VPFVIIFTPTKLETRQFSQSAVWTQLSQTAQCCSAVLYVVTFASDWWCCSIWHLVCFQTALDLPNQQIEWQLSPHCFLQLYCCSFHTDKEPCGTFFSFSQNFFYRGWNTWLCGSGGRNESGKHICVESMEVLTPGLCPTQRLLVSALLCTAGQGCVALLSLVLVWNFSLKAPVSCEKGYYGKQKYPLVKCCNLLHVCYCCDILL